MKSRFLIHNRALCQPIGTTYMKPLSLLTIYAILSDKTYETMTCEKYFEIHIHEESTKEATYVFQRGPPFCKLEGNLFKT